MDEYTDIRGDIGSNRNPVSGIRTALDRISAGRYVIAMGEHATFLRNFLRHPSQVGAIAPSSPSLVRTMVEWFQWDTARNIVEFGSGTGVFTEAIASHMTPDAKFFAIERSLDLAQATRLRCPGVTVYHDNVTNVSELCGRERMDSVDAIICGLPWASFPDAMQDEILRVTLDALSPGAQFATFAYWQGVILPAGRRFARKLRGSFSQVHRSPTAWRNLPPAFVYRCVR